MTCGACPLEDACPSWRLREGRRLRDSWRRHSQEEPGCSENRGTHAAILHRSRRLFTFEHRVARSFARVQVDPVLKMIAALAIIFLSFALVGLATGLGARHPRFDADATQVAGSPPRSLDHMAGSPS